LFLNSKRKKFGTKKKKIQIAISWWKNTKSKLFTLASTKRRWKNWSPIIWKTQISFSRMFRIVFENWI